MEAAIAISDAIRPAIDVSIVMPCLDEAKCLPSCIANAKEALETMQRELGLRGEIIVADNGSSDGSQLIARALGARVVEAQRRGYGAALIEGMRSAAGDFLVMGDADGSYDFRESIEMVRRLAEGADLCTGSRFKGRIETGAMPLKNRYLGNPALTFVLNLFFRANISDAHCGLRALTKPCFDRLDLSGDGMEFASEMIIKAALKGERIVETPATLSRDLRDRPPHLRPWRDGWRHLRYLLMLSPTWVFAVPALTVLAASAAILIYAIIAASLGIGAASPIGNQWVILAGAMIGLSHIAGLLAAATHLYGVRQGYRRPAAWTAPMAHWISLESMLASGLVVGALGFAILLMLLGYWTRHGFLMISTVLPAVTGTTLIVVGAQNMLGGFLLAIINGHEADFLKANATADTGRLALDGECRKAIVRDAPGYSIQSTRRM